MKGKIKIIASMLIWGSMGVLVRQINLPAGRIALIRAVIGLAFLLGIGFVLRKPLEKKALVSNKWILLASGLVLGANWIFLFEAYKHTTIATATVSYYLAPIIIAILSTLLLKEKMTIVKMSLTMTALVGLAFVSGVFGTSQMDEGNGIGIFFGVAAAFAYAGFTIMNKYIKNLSSMNSTMAQFGVSTIVLIPYTFFCENTPKLSIPWDTVVLLSILGVIHTGLAFWLFFSAIRELKAQTIAVLSYLDPVTAVLLSAVLLNEKLGTFQWIGAGIILVSAFLSGYLEEVKLFRYKNVIHKTNKESVFKKNWLKRTV